MSQDSAASLTQPSHGAHALPSASTLPFALKRATAKPLPSATNLSVRLDREIVNRRRRTGHYNLPVRVERAVETSVRQIPHQTGAEGHRCSDCNLTSDDDLPVGRDGDLCRIVARPIRNRSYDLAVAVERAVQRAVLVVSGDGKVIRPRPRGPALPGDDELAVGQNGDRETGVVAAGDIGDYLAVAVE
jgi:hypothetical protein